MCELSPPKNSNFEQKWSDIFLQLLQSGKERFSPASLVDVQMFRRTENERLSTPCGHSLTIRIFLMMKKLDSLTSSLL